MLWKTHQFLTLINGTVQEIEHKSRTEPLFANFPSNTVEMEDVFAPLNLNTGPVAQTFGVTH